MDLELKGKIILVTGGASGIGRAISLSLARESAVPVIIDIDKIAGDSLIKEIKDLGVNSLYIEADLCNPRDCESSIESVLSNYQRIDGLVNNAGINDGVSLSNGSYELFVQGLHYSLVHYYMMAHYCLPALKESRGTIVNIGSKVAETGQGGTSSYAAANGGRNALTREWAVELLPYGIRVNAVIVGECETPQYQRWINKFPDSSKVKEQIIKKVPLGKRMTTPDEVADTALFLLSNRSSHTTGELIHVDGGYVNLDRAIV